jgi:hypothetical protein
LELYNLGIADGLEAIKAPKGNARDVLLDAKLNGFKRIHLSK